MEALGGEDPELSRKFTRAANDPFSSKRAYIAGSVLDELCPPLATTPRLQDKALRVVLSVGVASLFGRFTVPEEDIDDL